MLDRRNFLKSAASVAALGVSAIPATADPFAFSDHGDWRTYEIRTVVEIDSPEPVRIWAPAAAFDAPDWSRPLGTNWTGNADFAEIVRDPAYGAEFVQFDWRAGSGGRRAEIVSRVATRDRAVDIRAGKGAAARFVARRARAFHQGDRSHPHRRDRQADLRQDRGRRAQAISRRRAPSTIGSSRTRSASPSTRGCGSGDIKAMLAAEKLGGKCADINGLFVGLVRAAGLPARDLYGLRVASSRFGYKSLGVASTDVTKAQHCRADVWLEGIGWTPMDAADVRKVMLEEPPTHLSADEPKVVAAREALIGSCEGQLGRVQLRARRRVARRLGRAGRLSHVS